MASSDSLPHQSTEVMPRLFAGRYAPVRLLGVGGQKVVYLAHDQELQRDCALGVVDPGAMGAEEVQRLRDEARAMARFGPHPNLVTVFDIGVHEGRPFCALFRSHLAT